MSDRAVTVEELELARQDQDHWTVLLVEVDYRDWTNFRAYCLSFRVLEKYRPDPVEYPHRVMSREQPRHSIFKRLEDAKRFSQKRLEALAAVAKADPDYAGMTSLAKANRGF